MRNWCVLEINFLKYRAYTITNVFLKKNSKNTKNEIIKIRIIIFRFILYNQKGLESNLHLKYSNIHIKSKDTAGD